MLKTFFPFLLIVSSLSFAGETAYRDVSDTSDLPLLSHSLKEREIAKIQLNNYLNVYIISDPEADQSAAALSVGSGSWSDPKEYPGMAHLLEHMLFMGTEGFPGESEFSSYLADHGGRSNAYTAPDRTVYMFDINNDSFISGLDRFSNFFINPILSPDSMSRELHNVDQEHAKNIENDGWRTYMISKEMGNQNHPNCGFSTGNSETLSPVPPEAMRAWFEANYAPQDMNLVIYSRLEIDELKKQVALLFCRIPKREKENLQIEETLLSNRQKGHITTIKPIKDLTRLSITWELPQKFASDTTKSADLIAYALSRGQKFSLSEKLKKEGLIDNISISTEAVGKYNIVFEIDLALTNEGLEKKDLVIQRCFEAVHGLQESGVPSYLFDEMTTMAALDYQYQSREDAFSFVSSLAGTLQHEELSTYPRKTILADVYTPSNISEILTLLTPKSAQYTLICPPEKSGKNPTYTEKWMGAEYSVGDIDTKTFALWEDAMINPEIKLAHPNPFLPSSLAIIDQKKRSAPFKFIDDDLGKLFYLDDDEFRSPEVMHLIHIKSPLVDKSAISQVCTQIFLNHLGKKLHPTLLCTRAAGLGASFSTDQGAITIAINGYSEKASFLIEEILKMAHSKPTESEFQIIQNYLQKAYANSARDLPIYQALELTASLIKDDKTTNHEKLEAIAELTYEDYLLFSDVLFEESYTEGFLSGNLTLKDAESIWLDIRHILGSEPYPKEERFTRIVTPLPNNGPFFIQKKTPAAGNSAVLVLDEGDFTFEKRAAQTLLSKALHEAFFNTLRTKQKTAYIAASIDKEEERRLFQYFLVQSSTHDPLDLVYRFELFIENYLQNLSSKIPEDRFDTLKKSGITQLEKPFRNLDEKTLFYDLLAFSYDEDFDWKEKRIQGLEALDYKRFLSLTKEFLSRDNRKRLAILYSGELPKNHLFSYENITPQHLRELSHQSHTAQAHQD